MKTYYSVRNYEMTEIYRGRSIWAASKIWEDSSIIGRGSTPDKASEHSRRLVISQLKKLEQNNPDNLTATQLLGRIRGSHA